VESIANRLRGCGALAASMTGSGSAVFGLFGSEEEARAALQRVRAEGREANILSYTAVAPFCRTGVEFISSEQPS
jgi:4-diphosphocytidyl-2C-methyl-D-erythritol kinase